MNATSNALPARLPRRDRAWIADWRAFNAVHFSLPPDRLAAHVPYPLECHDGRAWVSLVWFELSRIRFAGSGTVGQLLCRPISDHPFLNVRTYVRGPNGPGICFLAEWIPNRINCVLGPLLYGLPYRLGQFTTRDNAIDGTASLRITDSNFGAGFAVNIPTRRADARRCPAGSLDEFLLERYQAYTFGPEGTRGSRVCARPSRPSLPSGNGHRFWVAHVPWEPTRADWVRCDLGFLREAFPWFATATLELAHVCGDLCDVEMGFPHRVALDNEAICGSARESGELPVPVLTNGATSSNAG